MSTPETPLLERLCRSLAFHVVETEGTMQFMDTPLDLIAEAAQCPRRPGGMLSSWPRRPSIR